MAEKCKNGSWGWILVKTPIAVFKATRDTIAGDPYECLFAGGVCLSFTTFAVIAFLGWLAGGVVFLIAVAMMLYGYYKMAVCEKGEK